jgi:hypothetical protein
LLRRHGFIKLSAFLQNTRYIAAFPNVLSDPAVIVGNRAASPQLIPCAYSITREELSPLSLQHGFSLRAAQFIQI